MKLGLQACCGYFQVCVKNESCGPNFWPQNFGGFGPFSQKKIDVRLWHLVYRHIVGAFQCVCEKLPLLAKFLVPNKAEIGNFGSLGPFSQTVFSAKLTQKLALQAYCEYFQACVKNDPCGSNFWPPISVWYKTKFGSQNLAANLGNHLYGLPKLVATIISKFHLLVNTGLAVGSLVKWLPIRVATAANYTQSKWFITSQLEMAPSDCNCL